MRKSVAGLLVMVGLALASPEVAHAQATCCGEVGMPDWSACIAECQCTSDCSPIGECNVPGHPDLQACADHDICYINNDCRSNSWYFGGDNAWACQACNGGFFWNLIGNALAWITGGGGDESTQLMDEDPYDNGPWGQECASVFGYVGTCVGWYNY